MRRQMRGFVFARTIRNCSTCWRGADTLRCRAVRNTAILVTICICCRVLTRVNQTYRAA